MLGSIEIQKTGITELEVDAIVNAANSSLRQGGGVCGAVFRDAGPDKLYDACSKIGGCKTGNAVITPGFDLKAKYIIHAVGPIWNGGDEGEADLLYGAYENSLELAKSHDCSSIAFPVISSGIYGYPKEEAWRIGIGACRNFIAQNPDYEIRIVFAVLSQDSLNMGESVLNEF